MRSKAGSLLCRLPVVCLCQPCANGEQCHARQSEADFMFAAVRREDGEEQPNNGKYRSDSFL